jgi:hypothetical protein
MVVRNRARGLSQEYGFLSSGVRAPDIHGLPSGMVIGISPRHSNSAGRFQLALSRIAMRLLVVLWTSSGLAFSAAHAGTAEDCSRIDQAAESTRHKFKNDCHTPSVRKM